MDVLERIESFMCETCSGTGKEICDNPDHGFLSAISSTDTGRIGCPCCGHDEDHAIPNTICLDCNGTGKMFVVNTEILDYAKLGKQMQWVSVKDRLPKDCRRLWIYADDYIYVGRFECGKFYDIELSLKDVGTVVAKYKEIKNVTHYMPLPPNPKEGE
jgi:hypothetical protein